ncbi:hypothetical protein [Hyperthermus butylicus]|uniref:Uncharacterized protein n=1 Tax=Hyperthermus butylicus (strain DSM 5456 / JCM 9403 / PLM1-5) TaxID=415426 RepID=A2BKE2_HYPBU|nr:hypothetical protein [Hyperthermus butylicus]ABM80453.1 hypothetical protein Hbut_0593 [Hyperthermus butylicus DSM 5456]
MAEERITGRGGYGAVNPSELLEALRLGFDDMEAYAYMAGGDVVLRVEYELLVLRVPRHLLYWDLTAYLRRLGSEVAQCGHTIYFTYNAYGLRIVYQARIIHIHRGNAYLAVAPRHVGKMPRCGQELE